MKTQQQQHSADLSVPATLANRRLLKSSEALIAKAESEQALLLLRQLNVPELNDELVLLAGRLDRLKSEGIKGILSTEEARLEHNRINAALFDLVEVIRSGFRRRSEYAVPLRAYLQQRYRQRLEQKMADRQPLNLRLVYSTDGTSELGALAYHDRVVPGAAVGSDLLDAFDVAHGRLLLVGLPGAGKTTLLLQLALAMLAQPDAPVPILMNLSTWKSDFHTLDEWLELMLHLEINTSRQVASKIREEEPLVLLLDGLDEVAEAERASCLEAIGGYGSRAERQFVISSRSAEYKASATDAPVNAQLAVSPLELEAMIHHLETVNADQPESRRMLVAIREDQLFAKAVLTPFYFNIAQTLFAKGKGWADFKFDKQDVEGRKQELLQAFIEEALFAAGKKHYAPERIVKSLGFLAVKMRNANQVVFELLHIQPDWIEEQKSLNSRELFRTRLVGLILVITTLVVLEFGNSYVFFRLFSAIVTVFIFFSVAWKSLQFGSDKKIITTEASRWKWKQLRKNALKALIATFTLTLGFEYLLGLVKLAGEFIYYWTDDRLEAFSVPKKINTGQSWWGTLIGVIASFSICLFWAGLVNVSFTPIQRPYQRFFNSLRNLNFSLVEHFILRLELYSRKWLPLRLVTFLQEMSRRHLLETDGGTWRFRHKIIQDYFAETYQNPFGTIPASIESQPATLR